jgi:hypothetical protein
VRLLWYTVAGDLPLPGFAQNIVQNVLTNMENGNWDANPLPQLPQLPPLLSGRKRRRQLLGIPGCVQTLAKNLVSGKGASVP